MFMASSYQALKIYFKTKIDANANPYQIIQNCTFRQISIQFTEIYNAVNIIGSLFNFRTYHGVPNLIVADSGTDIKNGLVKEFLDLQRLKDFSQQ